MKDVVLVVVLLGGCLLMHILMMRKGGHCGRHGSGTENLKNKEENKKDGGSCCHPN